MLSPTFLVTAISLAIALIPVLLLRRAGYARAEDYFVSSDPTRLNVIQNSSIAYVLRLAIFVPLFGWGASGDFSPAIVAAVALGLGLWVVYVLRAPIFAFMGEALKGDQSPTINAFIARQHGNDVCLRLFAAGLTLLALAGLAAAEAVGLAMILMPVLSNDAGLVHAIVLALVLLAVITAAPAGNSGVMHATQLQLGLIYLGLFGSAVLLVYLQASELRPLPPHGTLAVVFIAALAAIMPFYRRVRFVETGPVRDDSGAGRGKRGAKLFTVLLKMLNVFVCIFAGFVVGFAIVELYGRDLAAIVTDSAAALQMRTSAGSLALAALFLAPLFGQITDITNWQRMAAFEKDRDPNDPDDPARWVAFRRCWTTYAVESPLVWLFVCAFGALAVVSTATPDGTDVGAFLGQLASQENFVAAIALPLLLVGVLAMATSTMSSLVSASLWTIRYDVLAALSPQRAPGAARDADEVKARRLTVLAGGGLFAVVVAAVLVAAEHLHASFTSNGILALLFAFGCIQLAFVPLVLGPLIGRTRGAGTVGPAWALVILGTGSAVGVGAVAVYLATGQESWLWAAVPATLGAGGLLFALALSRRRTAA
jgi:hypothetical protein